MLSSSKVYTHGSHLSENLKLKPITNYGKNKLKTEKNVIKHIENYLIFKLINFITKKNNKSKTSVTNTFFDQVRTNLKKKK